MIGDDVALYRFGLCLFGAFTIIIIVSVAFQRAAFLRDAKLSDWLTAAFTAALAFFTLELANVASQQTEILSHTDAALHLAATAESASAQTAEKLRLFTETTNRAWIGPTSARSDPFEAGKPIKINVSYSNTGRLLASFTAQDGGKFFTKEEWSDGRVLADVSAQEKDCENGLSHVDKRALLSGMAYPTSGFSGYTLTFNSNDPNIAASRKIILTQDLLDPDFIYVFVGCFVYGTGKGEQHHSFFCYYHEVGVSDDINNLTYCPFGQDAD
jgi:hypothetical protein